MPRQRTSILQAALAAFRVAAVLGALAEPSSAQCHRFRRGDANSDAVVDLSDPVATLVFLFAGGGAPGCLDAADSDDSGILDISDAVYTLSYLFLGTAPPPAPGPSDCGRDPTFDDLACEMQPPCIPTPEGRDFASFTRFEYAQEPGLGFCGEVGTVRTATIQKTASGSYRLEMSILVEGTPDVDPCLFPEGGLRCVVDQPLAPRDLTDAEAQRVREAFASVPLYTASDEICDCIAIDPCAIRTFRWDEETAGDFVCSAPRLDPSETTEVVALLESLRPQG